MNQLLNALGKPRLKIDQSRCRRREQASQVQGEENAGDTNRHAEVGASVPGETEQQHSKDGYQHQADFSRGRFYIGVAEVSGQDQLRLNQRKHQAADDDRRHDRHDLAHEADTEHQWHEGRDCGQHTEGYGNRDALRAFDRAWQHLEAFLVARMHTLADDDGIVDEDTQHQNKAEQGNHVDAEADRIRQEECAKEGNWHAKTNPEGEAGPQEQGEQDQYHHETLAATFEQGIETVIQQG